MTFTMTVKQCKFNGNFVYVSSKTLKVMRSTLVDNVPAAMEYFGDVARDTKAEKQMSQLVVSFGSHLYYYACDSSCLLERGQMMISPYMMEENGLAEGDSVAVSVVGYGSVICRSRPFIESISVEFEMTGHSASIPIAAMKLTKERLVSMFGEHFVPVKKGQTLFFTGQGVRGGAVLAMEPDVAVGRITGSTKFLFKLRVGDEHIDLDELWDKHDRNMITKPTEEELLERQLKKLSIGEVRGAPKGNW
jgi:hypothetical protein